MLKPLKLLSWKFKRKFWQQVLEFLKLHISRIMWTDTSTCVCVHVRVRSRTCARVSMRAAVTLLYLLKQATSCEISPHSPHMLGGPIQDPVASSSSVPGGPLCNVCGVWSSCPSANTPSIADMKGCQKCDGWVASWGLATAATSGVRGEIGSERVKYSGPPWPDNYPDWIHLTDRRE